jgi:hypothetical protein
MTANDIIQRNAECARQLLEAGAEIEMLRAADKVRVTVHEAEIRRLAIECGQAKDEIKRLRERLGPVGLEVVEIDGAGHYVNEKVKAEIERLTAQLPDGMKHCTIRFIECEKGHGRLTAANWVDTGCQSCEIERLRDEIEGLRADLMIAGGKFAEVMDENERLRAALLMPLSSDELRLVDKNCDWIAFKHAWNAIMKRRALETKP